VGRRLVKSLVRQFPRVSFVLNHSFISSKEKVLDVFGDLVFSLLEVVGVCDQGRESVADGAFGAVPFPLGRILGIQGRLQASKMIGIFTSVAAEQITTLAALVTVIAVVGGFTVKGAGSANVASKKTTNQ
jgi:hypothetical protein